MDNDIDYLALGSSTRYVARCGYQCVNLVWERLTIHLTARELQTVNDFFTRCEGKLLQDIMYGDTDHFVMCHENGYREVWLMGIGLYLDPTNYAFLMTLAQEAVEHLQDTMETWVPWSSWVANGYGTREG